MKSITIIFTFAAVLVLQFSAVAQTNVQAVQTNAPVVRVNKAIIPVPRTDPERFEAPNICPAICQGSSRRL